MKYIMCSRTFPKGHPKEGQPTWFAEKILNGFREDFQLPDFFKPWIDNYTTLLKGEDYLKAMAVREFKHHTIRAGSRFKPGEPVSLRVWSDKPRRSKQIEFAQVEVKKTWDVEIFNQGRDIRINGEFCDFDCAKAIAKNDGLEWMDFVNWFNIHPKKQDDGFQGQIICWNDSIEYSKPSLLTEKQNNE